MSNFTSRRAVVVALGCVGLASVLGCSGMSDAPKLAKVKGVVKLKGKPLSKIGVTFFPTSGPAAFGNTNDQGEFELMTINPGDGAAVGTHRVTLGKAEEGSSEKGSVALIPDRYGMPDKSGLTAEVKEGEKNFFEFDLK